MSFSSPALAVSSPPLTQGRHDSLDVLRGFAILGILAMNIQGFAMVATAYVNPTLAGSMTGIDFVLWLISHLFAEYKFISIFSALFGAGIVLMAERAELAGVSPRSRHRRRMLLLGAVGLIHGVFIWYGDILFLYGVVGLLAYRFRTMPVPQLLRWALLFYLVPLAAGLLFTLMMAQMPAADYQSMAQDMWQPSAGQLQAEVTAYQGSYGEQLSQRLETLLEGYLLMMVLEEGWRVLALMLAGMAAYRSGLLTGQWQTSTYGRLALAGFALGLPVVLLGVAFNQYHEWEMLYAVYLGRAFNGLAAPVIALAWTCSVIYALKQGWFPAFRQRLQAVGRTALSCYLLTSLLCTGIFYGFGLGLFAELQRPGQWGVMMAVWVILLLLAPWWLRHFPQGPMEWLLRRGVYR
ncbi:MAG: DUF418 domain-containing protein [Halomonadaceae bacterium]|nr:MAG: DUF418 domain-containing protein [Halomonadaceae bacterium]